MLSFAPAHAFTKMSNSRPHKAARQRIAFLSPKASPDQPEAVSEAPAVAPDVPRYDFSTLVSVPCFVKGTRIQTRGQAVPIEELKVGDSIETRDNGVQKIRWIVATELVADAHSAPIEFAPGAFGNAVASRVSPSHRVLLSGWRCKKIAGVDEVFAQAKDLVNDRDIFQVEGGTVTYYHMALDGHQVVIADGIYSESFHPNRLSPRKLAEPARDSLISSFPAVGAAPDSYGPAARPDIQPFEARLIRP